MYEFFSFCTLIRDEKFKSLSKTARLLYIYMLTDSYISGSGGDGFEFPQEVQKEWKLLKRRILLAVGAVSKFFRAFIFIIEPTSILGTSG